MSTWSFSKSSTKRWPRAAWRRPAALCPAPAELMLDRLVVSADAITVVAEEIEPERDDDVLRYEVTVLVERDSQKGMVIGKGGRVIKDAGTLAREELEALLGAPVFLDTSVKVERDWQRRAHALDRLGY